MSPEFQPAQGHQILRHRWVDLITGGSSVDPRLPVFQAAIALLDTTCERILEKAEIALIRTQVFIDDSLDSDAAMTRSFVRLQTLSKAWATPGSTYYQSTYVRNFVVDALQDLTRIAYHPGRDKPGNWWSWEIGCSKALMDTVAIFRDHITERDVRAYSETIDYFVPDPWFQQGGIVSTGANRVDLCQAVIVRSILTGDDARLKHAIEGLPATWQWVTSGDGFYRDGSYVQHATIAYTGTYGVVLLEGLSLIFALLAGSAHDIADTSRAMLYDAIERSYAPFIFRGRMMDAVRGRAISREDERSVYHGNAAIEAILRLSLVVDHHTAERWRGLCRGWVDEGGAGAAGPGILADASVVRTALVHDLMTSDALSVPDVGAGRLFPAMDRLVHRGARAEWTFAVAMSSRRISWYECGNGENDLGAQTGAGMTYLYLDTADNHFDDEFWPTSDLAAPSGTTVDTTPLPPRVEGQWGSHRPENEWTGGTILDEWSLAGQHLIGPGDTGLRARKTWFAGPDFVACLGADITCFPPLSGVDADSTVVAIGRTKSVVEHRNTGVSPARLVIDGRPIGASVVLQSPSWAHLAGTGGYVFLTPATVSAAVAARSGSWQAVNAGGSDTVHTRYYATIEVRHPASGVGEYAYLVLPAASEGETRLTAVTQPVMVAANTAEVQAIVTGDVTAVNFWRATSAAGITVDHPASVIVKRAHSGVTVAVSDPTQTARQLTIEFADTPCVRIEGEGVVMSGGGPVTRVMVDVQGRAGLPVSFQLLGE